MTIKPPECEELVIWRQAAKTISLWNDKAKMPPEHDSPTMLTMSFPLWPIILPGGCCGCPGLETRLCFTVFAR
jgi:hypothetical protein